jgi:hypothetical protein
MSFNQLIFSLTFLLSISCSQRINSQDEYLSARKLYTSYVIDKNKTKLKKAYKELISIDDFKKHGLTSKNITIVVPIYMKMEKHRELVMLLEKKNALPMYEKEFLINLNKGLELRCSHIDSSNFYFIKNMNFIKNEILKNPSDSSKISDYYLNRLYLEPLPIVIKEIELEKKSPNNKVTLFFYDEILLKSIIEFEPEIKKCI